MKWRPWIGKWRLHVEERRVKGECGGCSHRDVEVTRDVTLIKRENDKLGQDLEIIRETQDLEIVKETWELKEVTEMQKSKEVNELHETKVEHTQVELGGDMEVELGECVGTQCEGQINLPQERGETVCSFVAGCDEVSPVRPYEVKWVHGANEHMPSLGGIETPESFGLT